MNNYKNTKKVYRLEPDDPNYKSRIELKLEHKKYHEIALELINFDLLKLQKIDLSDVILNSIKTLHKIKSNSAPYARELSYLTKQLSKYDLNALQSMLENISDTKSVEHLVKEFALNPEECITKLISLSENFNRQKLNQYKRSLQKSTDKNSILTKLSAYFKKTLN